METNRPWVPIDKAVSLSDLRYRCKKIDLFDLETPREIIPFAEFAWAGFGKGGYRLGLTGGAAVFVVRNILGQWEVQIRQRAGGEKTIAARADLPAAVRVAESLVKKDFQDHLVLVRLNTRWRREPASGKQIRILRARKIDTPEGLTKGQASHLIGMLSR